MSSQSQFGRLFNVANYAISGSTTSTTVLVPYYQFIFVVDISNSMAVGGTSTAINQLGNSAQFGNCAFACHNPNHISNGPDYRALAKQQNIQLKIDYVNMAVQNFISSLSSQTSGTPGVFSVGIDTFGTAFSTLHYPSSPPSSALPDASTIDVEAANNPNNGYINTSSALQSALNNTQNIGDGSSPTSQATYIIFLSDGVEDTLNFAGQWGRSTDVTYGSACTSIKQAGATLITIEANYPSIPGDEQYATLVAPLAAPNTPNMQTAMQACATDASWAYQANDGPGIASAVSAVLNRVVHGLTRITG